MSSIYNFLTPEDKLMVETMWTALFEGLSALFYNLAQSALSPLQSLGNGYLEDSYNTIPIYNKGNNKSITKEFDVDQMKVTRIVKTPTTYYILADRHIYSLKDGTYWVDYHTQDSTLEFDDLAVLNNTLYGIVNSTRVVNGVTNTQGLYEWIENRWTLVWKQTSLRQITALSTGGYLVRKVDSAGFLLKISYNEPYYKKTASLTTLSDFGPTVDFTEHAASNTAWLLMQNAVYRVSNLTSNTWTFAKVTGLPDTTVYRSINYITASLALVATDNEVIGLLTAGSAFQGSSMYDLTTIYTDPDNKLFEGSAQQEPTIYINKDTGFAWTGDKNQLGEKWYTGATYVEGVSVPLYPVVQYSYVKDGVTIPLNKVTEYVVDMAVLGGALYILTDKHIYYSPDGASLTTHAKILTSANFTGLEAGTTDLKVASTDGVLSIPAYSSGTVHTSFTNLGQSPEHVTLNENYYLSIPALVGAVTNTRLAEGVDYEIQDFNRLRFLKKIDNSASITESGIGLTANGEDFYLISGIYLNPNIPNIYFPAFGEKYPRVALDARVITPYVSGYNNLTTYHDKQKAWAKHLAHFCWAGANALRAQPTMQNFEKGYSVMRGLPFAYQNEYYNSSWEDGNNRYLKTLISGTTDSYFTYEVAKPATFNTYSGNQYIPRHDILVSGVKFYDYVTDEDLMVSLSDRKLSSVTTASGLGPHTHIYEIDAQGNGIATTVSGVDGATVGDHMHYINNSLVGPANGVDGEHIHELPVLNIEEKYHILGINISNVNKNLTYSNGMLDNFVQNTTPAIYFKKEFNRAPTVNPTADKKFYNNSDIPTLNALTSDPEGDILYYRWVYSGPFTTSDGKFIEPVISGITDQNTQTSLTQPLVDTKMTFNVEVNDDFNRVTRPLHIYVSGQYNFDSWGDAEFKIEDLNIDFETQTEMNS